MAVEHDHEVITSFDQWYIERRVDDRDGCLDPKGVSPAGSALAGRFRDFKREMDARCQGFEKLEMVVDAEVVSQKPDLPNVSSGEVAGLVRRMARNLVQNVPNLEILSKFDDDSVPGIIADYTLRSKIVGSDQYSNDMQQNLFASVKTGLTIGFDCVVPVLLQRSSGEWVIEYDSIHYRDVFPEPGAKDVRKATEVFVRRYLTRGEVKQLIRDQVSGWDHAALKALLKHSPRPPAREAQSNSYQDTKRKVVAEGYEVVTWYTSSGAPFLTFSPTTGHLLRIEKNKHPLKWHPVFFLVLEKDAQQPLGKSQVELVYGRQEFQDLMHNGAMKMWYRNINPPILGFGAINAMPNLGPGKYTPVSNPNARIEPFEVNTQTLLQYQSISQGNLGSMVNTVGAADQQMAVQAGNGMSATPQGVEAQQAMVDITTNNYQKAIESFFSHFCSYALTIYFQELKSIKKIFPNAITRMELVNAGIDPKKFDEDGALAIDFSEMATEYYVRCVPGSLVEMEDEKQLRVLNQLFVPLSQAMPALAQLQDQEVLRNAAAAMIYIIEKEIELSGSMHSSNIKTLMQTGKLKEAQQLDSKLAAFEQQMAGVTENNVAMQEAMAQSMQQMQEQMKLLSESQGALLQKLGVGNEQPASIPNNAEQQEMTLSP